VGVTWWLLSLALVGTAMFTKTYYVYLLASRRNGTLYVGVTNDLVRRVCEHKNHVVPGFTKRYDVTRLVWFEYGDSIAYAIQREKQIKAWKRAWKIDLFRDSNPNWDDLYPGVARQS
jgi:putative endonuclease